MTITRDLMNRMMERHGGLIDLKERPEVLDDLVREVTARLAATHPPPAPTPAPTAAPAPFGVSWMDSWVAHWVYAQNVATTARRDRELATVMEQLVDMRFRARLEEIRSIIGGRGGLRDEPPDGGPPEPGVPPAPDPGPSPGPAEFGGFGRRFDEPPDGGPPEPGVPPAPEPSPDPGPSPGPADFGAFRENPWILYWFISLKTPMLLDVIDLHISRRLSELRR